MNMECEKVLAPRNKDKRKIMMEKINDRNRSKGAECDGTHRGQGR